MHVIAGKAVALKEALDPEFKVYIDQVVKNTAVMSDEFIKAGLHVITGGTDNHLLNMEVLPLGINGKEAQDLLDTVYITLNKEAIPNETLSPFKTSGVRIGAAAMTSRGFKENEARQVAQLVTKALKNHDNQVSLDEVRKDVLDLTKRFPLY